MDKNPKNEIAREKYEWKQIELHIKIIWRENIFLLFGMFAILIWNM